MPRVLPLGALAVTRAISETPRTAGRRPDVQGSVAALLALSAVSVVLILGPAGTAPRLVAVAALLAVAAVGWFVTTEQHAPDPLLPLPFFRRRQFLGANVIWLLGCMTCWDAVFFLAVHLQVTLGLRPVTAGLLLTPIYLVMMAGSPVAAALDRRCGRRRLVSPASPSTRPACGLLGTVDPATGVP